MTRPEEMEMLEDMDLTEKSSESSSHTRRSTMPFQILMFSTLERMLEASSTSLDERYLESLRSQETVPISEGSGMAKIPNFFSSERAG